jgi:hypothetical protein
MDENKSNIFDGLFESEEDSKEKILLQMINPDDVAPKTEIQRPLNLARMKMLAVWCRQEGLNECADFIEDAFIEPYLIYMISKDRQSRKEVFGALTEAFKEERSLGEKLASKPE